MAKMGRPVSDKMMKARDLLSTPHPLSPSGQLYTIREAAEAGGVPYMTLFYHAKKLKQAPK